MKNRYDSGKNISAAEFNSLNTDEKIMRMSSDLSIPAGKNQQQVLEAILSGTSRKTQPNTIKLTRYFMAVAAVMLLLIGFYSVSLVFSNEKIKTGFASQTTVKLPDGTLITLNAGSKLAWSERRFDKERTVTVDGEAFFDVKKGSRFTIKTHNGNVTILGTQLNVFSRENDFRVSCITGKVGVSSGSSEVVLLPGEKAGLTNSGLQKTTSAHIEQTAAWKEGIFYFEDQPLVSIFGEIERQFNVSVKYKGNPGRLITVSFTNRKLEEALDVVCIPMGLKYELDKNNNINITEISK